MDNGKIAALVELGILCRGEPVEKVGSGMADPGPHRASGHNQFCRYERPLIRYPFENPTVEAFSYFEPDMSLDEAMARTKLVIVLGLAHSPEMRALLANREVVVIAFEPDERVLRAYLEEARLSELNRPNFFCFTGDPRSFNPALQDLLPEELFKRGTPAFFMTERIREAYDQWAGEVIDYFETLHYRHAIYPLGGQSLASSRPFRDIHRGLFFDQQVHAYENIPEFFNWPSIAQLKNRMRGVPAILVAAGPDLEERLDYLRSVKDRAVIISVNNAVKTLAEAGIPPHMVVINDTSIHAGEVFRHVPKLPGTILVGHCLSALGGDRFRQKYLFGSFLPHIFGEREMLRLHGSVISTAFALAMYMGCSQCIFVGAQLASNNPWGLNYVKGAVDKDSEEVVKELIHQHPQLCPVKTPFGETLYTTINFRDAALWLAEVVRLSGIPCTNTSRASILYGRGIEYDDAPKLPHLPIARQLAELYRPEPPRVDASEARNYLRHEMNLWTSVRDVAKSMLSESGQALTAKGMAIMAQLDKNNVTYLVQRYDGFNNLMLHQKIFDGDEDSRREGLRYYFDHVHRMSQEFLALLKVVSAKI